MEMLERMRAESAEAAVGGHPVTGNPIEEALRNGINFYPKNQNIDMGAFEAYNEMGGPPQGSKQQKDADNDEETDLEDSKAVAMNAGKLDLDDDLNLLQ